MTLFLLLVLLLVGVLVRGITSHRHRQDLSASIFSTPITIPILLKGTSFLSLTH